MRLTDREAWFLYDESVREKVSKELRPLLYRKVRAKVDSDDDAEDIVQEVLMGVLKNYRPDRGTSVKTYAFRVLEKRIADFYRNKEKQPQTVPLAQQNEEGEEYESEIVDSHAEAELEQVEIRSCDVYQPLRDCINELEVKYKVVIILHHGVPKDDSSYDPLTLPEIAHKLKCKIGTIKQHHHRAKQLLRKCLERKGLTIKDFPL